MLRVGRRQGDILVKTLLPAIDESSGDTLGLLLPVLFRNGDEHGSIGVVGFSVDLMSALLCCKERTMEGRAHTSSMRLVLE
jgi:hypothetical protein